MKKLFLTALALGAAMSLSAEDFVVYQNGQLNPELDYYGWYNVSDYPYAANPDGEGQVYTIKTVGQDGNTRNCSAGLNARPANDFIGKLGTATLEFDWYATAPGKLTIRTTSSIEQNYEITVAEADLNSWNHAAIQVSEAFPTIAQQWAAYDKTGSGYVFGTVFDATADNPAVYFNNVIYTGLDEAWKAPEIEQLPVPTTVPVPTEDAENVISVFSSAYTPATSFGIGGWGQSTQETEMEIDGKKVMKVQFFSYLGFELNPRLDITNCNYMHVDFFAANQTNFGFTPISPGKEKPYVAEEVKVGEWNSYDVPLSHWDVVDMADVFQIKFDQGNGEGEGYIANVYFYNDGNYVAPEPITYEYGAHFYGTASAEIPAFNTTAEVSYELIANEDGTLTCNATIEGVDGVAGINRQLHVYSDQWPNFQLVEDNDYTVTSTGTFELGFDFPDLFIWLPYAGGAARMDIDYSFGQANEKPAVVVAPKLKAQAVEVEATTAKIEYTVTLPEELADASVVVYINDEPAAESPVELTGLSPLTDYTYTLKAVATAGEETFESKPVTVSFKTTRDGATTTHYYVIVDHMLKNAYLPGEDPATDRRSLPVSIEADIQYNPDMTMTVEAVYHGQLPVGLVPHITLKSKFDRKPMTRIDDTHYTVTTPADVTYEYEENFDYLYFFMAYDGGDTGNEPAVHGYKAGMENEPVAYGEAANLVMSLASDYVAMGNSVEATAVVTDANGHYLFDEPVVLSVDNEAFEVNGSSVKALAKGTTTVTATAGESSASARLTCAYSVGATQLLNDNVNITANVDYHNLALIYDDNEGSQIVWDCNETQEHWLNIEFDKEMLVEAIELVWEGASATHYTLTLAPAAVQTEALRAAAQPKVFTVEGGQGGAGVTPRKTFHTDDFVAIPTQTIKLETSKAFDTGWGIKLKEMRVMGAEDETTLGVADVAVDAASAVEYYNLQGIRVANPANGIYIRRQGNTVTKVMVK